MAGCEFQLNRTTDHRPFGQLNHRNKYIRRRTTIQLTTDNPEGCVNYVNALLTEEGGWRVP